MILTTEWMITNLRTANNVALSFYAINNEESEDYHGKTNIHHRTACCGRWRRFFLRGMRLWPGSHTGICPFAGGQKAASPVITIWGLTTVLLCAEKPYTYLVHHLMGQWTGKQSSGGSAYRHYIATASGGSSQQVYCVESGASTHFRKIPTINGKCDHQRIT